MTSSFTGLLILARNASGLHVATLFTCGVTAGDDTKTLISHIGYPLQPFGPVRVA